MTSHSDIDTLIASLHPHVSMHLFNDKLHPPVSLQPSKNTADFRNLVQAFATLFSFHSGCDAAAVTAERAPQSGNTSLSICPSPSTPPGFEGNVKEWLVQFMDLRKEYKVTGGARHGDVFSPLEKSFILYTYKVCYPAMHQRTIDQGFGDWEVFVETPEAVADEAPPKPRKEEELLRKEYAKELRTFSELVKDFVHCMSRKSLGDDNHVLQFHQSCMSIRDMMSNGGFVAFLNEYIYCDDVDPTLTYFGLPLALSILLTLSQNSKLQALDDQWSFNILDPSKGARQFSTVMTKTGLAERFGKVSGIKWEHVVRVFMEKSAARPKGYGMGYEWTADKNMLSTEGRVPVHPEITLIQDLLENGDRKGEAYIACSRMPCYASVMYAGAVNQTLEPDGARFTMRADSPEWCQLYNAEPWILPEATQPDVMERMKEFLLRDLGNLMYLWVQELWDDGHIASGNSGWDLEFDEPTIE
ncbi:hypothetical protein LXA43DRAFT_682139 [Ganoderma leucocontextum]|nr:hypothetical protein LXA43DRAFT_682139 [Ganoderma leucocontextum]